MAEMAEKYRDGGDLYVSVSQSNSESEHGNSG
jgi:hypothetical protein